MINKITRKLAKKLGIDFDLLIDDFIDTSNEEHRKNSNYFTQSIVEINQYLDDNIPEEWYGFWETNTYVNDYEHGYDRNDIDTLTRVVQKERKVIETYWAEVTDYSTYFT